MLANDFASLDFRADRKSEKDILYFALPLRKSRTRQVLRTKDAYREVVRDRG